MTFHLCVVTHSVIPPPLASNLYAPEAATPFSGFDPAGQLTFLPLALIPPRCVIAGAPGSLWPQRWMQPPATFVPTHPVVALPSISQLAGHCPPGSAALGSENATIPVERIGQKRSTKQLLRNIVRWRLPVSGAPGLNLRPTQSRTNSPPNPVYKSPFEHKNQYIITFCENST